MTMNKIDETRLIIALADEDMQAFDLQFDQFLWSDSKSRHVIKELLLKAKEETGFSVNNRRLMIEALPRDSGCLIMFTILSDADQKHRKIYKIKIKDQTLIYKFPDSESLLCAIERVAARKNKIKDSCVLEYNDAYYMVLRAGDGLSLSESAILSEYAKLTGRSKFAFAKIEEHGNIICQNKAIETISRYLN